MKRRVRQSPRGVAMLLVLVGLAMLAVIASEVRYNSAVEEQLAANFRDETRAYFLAQSGIGLSRLVLRFQKQVDQIQLPNLGGLLASLSSGPLAGLLGPPAAKGPTGTPPQQAAAPTTMSIQLWRMAKIDCHMLAAMVPEDDGKAKKGGLAPISKDKKFDFDSENPELAAKQGARKFGGFEGCFDTVISDEEERINVAKLDAPALSAAVAVNQLVGLLSDKKYEFLFEREDSNRVKVTPNELILAMRDYADEDETGSQLNLSGAGEPFVRGFSDENGPYDRYDPRYRAKNGRYDSLDELFMVHGVNDRFMAAFKDRFTVYPDLNSRLNINTDDPVLLELAVRTIADPSKPDPRLNDPIFMDTILKRIRTARMFAIFGMSTADFVNAVAAGGVAVNPTIINNMQNQRFISDKSTTYRLQVTGSAGQVQKTITAVIRLDDGLGRLVYWREE
jgi:general secretion pathway protein K